MTKSKLRRCPFCKIRVTFNRGVLTHPKNTKCILASSNAIAWGLPGVVELWNTRALNKDRQLLVELSLPHVDFGTLCEEGYQSNTIKCGNKILMKSREIEFTERDTKKAGEAIIALKIRRHLKENP